MRKLIEDEIHDIMMRSINDDIAASFSVVSSPTSINTKDLIEMLDEMEKLSPLPDMEYVFVTRDGKAINSNMVINMLTATEEEVRAVFRNYPGLGFDLTGATMVAFERPKITWPQKGLCSSRAYSVSPSRETDTKEETNEVT